MKTTKTLLTMAMLFLYGTLIAQFPQIGNDIDGEAASDGSGWSVSLSANGNILAIGAPYNNGNGTYAGHVRIYEWTGTTWLQKGNDIDGEASEANSAYSVSLSADGNTLAVGAIGNDGNGNNAGHVRVYGWTGTAWLQKGNNIGGEAANDVFGASVSLSADGNILAIGAPGNDENGADAGHVRIYEWTGMAWLQKGNDIDGEAAEDFFGTSVSLSTDGNILAVGAYSNDGNGVDAGHVRIYEWTGTAWLQKGNDINGEAPDNYSGYSVSLSADGNILAIGAPGNDGNGVNAGHVRIYEWTGTAWLQKGNDIDGEVTEDWFGWSVSLSANGNMLAVGAPFNSTTEPVVGHVRVYEWTGTAWLQKGNDIDGEAMDNFSGYSVSLSADGNMLAIGAPYNDGNGVEAGHVRVYNLKSVYGYAYQDFNQNCQQDTLEIGLANRLFILNPGNILLQTNSNGGWFIDSLPVGTYTLTADTSSPNWQLTCPITQSFTITNPNTSFFAPSFGYISSYPCSAPEISIHAPFLRPGFSNQYVYVQACNTATASDILNSAYVVVELDALLSVDTASMAYTHLGNNQYQVNIGDLYPGQCINFWLSTTLSVNAVLGQTLCMNAQIYPIDSCALDSIPATPSGDVSPCTLPWDHSSLSVEGTCEGDSVRFVIYNTGQLGGGDMDCFAPVRVYRDGGWILLDSIQLVGGDSIVFMFYGNGTWRLEADQHPLHPGNSHPNATVENCGTSGIWTPNLVNLFPANDADPVIDIYCGLVTGSYDPNDKHGYPLGVGATNDIQPNQGIDYVIRFQNTGTDTAFTIVVRDTLTEYLDIFSVQSGAASHNYSFRIYGERVLEWTFNNIMLPDSNVNEPKSHGFISFKVKQAPNLPLGTVIENSAAIYFDFNAPIITNTSLHTINKPSIVSSTTPITPKNNTAKIFPNPTTGIITIQIDQDFNTANIEVFNALGQSLGVMQTNDARNTFALPNEAGIYFVKVSLDGGATVYKVLKTNGM